MTEPAAPPVPPYAPPESGAAVPAKRRGPSKARRFGDALGTVIGQALGALVLFPLLVGLFCAGMVYVFSDSGNGGHAYEGTFVATAGLAALFGLFFLVARWFGVLFFRFWPIILVIVGIVIAWKKLT